MTAFMLFACSAVTCLRLIKGIERPLKQLKDLNEKLIAQQVQSMSKTPDRCGPSI